MILEAKFAEANHVLNCDFCETALGDINHITDKNNPHKVTAEQIGAVKSVNGVTPDKNGNVEVAGGGSANKELIFTGAVSALYNGTEVVVVDIPEGEKGDKGDKGDPGVYVGSGDMPEGYNVQIDPSGDNSIDMVVEAVLAALPAAEGVAF